MITWYIGIIQVSQLLILVCKKSTSRLSAFIESDYAEIPEEIEANRSCFETNEGVLQIVKLDAISSNFELKLKKIDPELAIESHLQEEGNKEDCNDLKYFFLLYPEISDYKH